MKRSVKVELDDALFAELERRAAANQWRPGTYARQALALHLQCMPPIVIQIQNGVNVLAAPVPRYLVDASVHQSEYEVTQWFNPGTNQWQDIGTDGYVPPGAMTR